MSYYGKTPEPLPPLVPYHPRVSMDRDVYYKTQSATFDQLIVTGEDPRNVERYDKRGKDLLAVRTFDDIKREVFEKAVPARNSRRSVGKIVQHVVDLIEGL